MQNTLCLIAQRSFDQGTMFAISALADSGIYLSSDPKDVLSSTASFLDIARLIHLLIGLVIIDPDDDLTGPNSRLWKARILEPFTLALAQQILSIENTEQLVRVRVHLRELLKAYHVMVGESKGNCIK